MYQTLQDTDSSVVNYGTSADSLTSSASGSSSTYLETYDHLVILADLLPNTSYYYSVGDGDSSMSDVFSFHTPPTSASEEGANVNFAFFGDMGLVNGENTRTYLQQLVDDNQSKYGIKLGG